MIEKIDTSIKDWLNGYDCALIDFEEFLLDNKKLLSPSAFKTLAARFKIKFA